MTNRVWTYKTEKFDPLVVAPHTRTPAYPSIKDVVGTSRYGTPMVYSFIAAERIVPAPSFPT